MTQSYTFFTDDLTFSSVETKGQRRYFVTGYISTPNRDLVNDIVSQKALSDMLTQLTNKNIKLDVEHEAWKDSPNIVPIGRITESKMDAKGIWIKAELNASHSRFKEVWDSIKGGFLDAFSIAFTTVKATNKLVDGIKTRILEKIDLLNVALTGNPANPEAQLLSVITKSMEDYTMKEEPAKVVDAPAPVPATEIKTVEPAVETETKSDPRIDALQADMKSLKDSFDAQLAELKTAQAKVVEDKDTEIKTLKDKIAQPILKSRIAPEPVRMEKLVNPLDAI
jgi:HK97 family phage prohead protease